MSQRSTTSNLLAVGQIFHFLKPYRLAVSGALLALLVGVGSVLAMGQVLRRGVDEGLSSTAHLDRVLLVFLGVVGILAIAAGLRAFLFTWIGERVVADLRRAVFDHVLTLEPGFFEVTRTGEIISRLITDTTLLQAMVSSTLSTAVRNGLMLTGGIAMLAITSPKLTALVSLGAPLVVLPLWVLGRRVRRLSRASQDRVADVGSYVDETLHGIRTVQAFCHEAVDRSQYGERVEQAFFTAMRRTRVRAVLTSLAVLVVFVAVGVVLWIGGYDLLAGRISAGELSAFVFYSMLVAGSVHTLSEVAGSVLQAAGAAERLMELLSTKPQITASATPIALPHPPRGEVAFDRVSFHYPSRAAVRALDDFSLRVRLGEKVALVGPSGAGKSTVFQLLLRFYDPQAGAITLDGVNVRDAEPQDVRAHIGLVPQEPVIFAANAWENIRYGLADVTDEAVRAAADAAHASEFLERLPNGFDTFLGERGVRLSGGQRQRIAIARAILRNPAVLLLDEATSALDAEGERWVQEALEELMRGRTTLIIAHRLATVRGAGRIVVMDHGRIVAIGTHTELVKHGGLYARLAALQFGQDDTVLEERVNVNSVLEYPGSR